MYGNRRHTQQQHSPPGPTGQMVNNNNIDLHHQNWNPQQQHGGPLQIQNQINQQQHFVDPNSSRDRVIIDNQKRPDPELANPFDETRVDMLRKGQLYEDPDFPADDRSLYFSRQPPFKLEWLRPSQILKQADIARKFGPGIKPELFVGGATRFDLNQGKLGDCWVVAALGSISENMELIYNIIPRGQSFRQGWYAGMFRFRFWQFGKWIEVTVDDRLPTVRGQLVFVHSNSVNEFWGALVEKAYAKLMGSYEALKGGHIAEAMTDFTGGLTESYTLTDQNSVPRNVVNIMFKALERQSVIGCSIDPVDANNPGETIRSNGLATGHAYSITDMRELRIPYNMLPASYRNRPEIRLISDRGEIPITLVRVRNPWGSRIEWTGAWSDKSPEWNSIPEQDRRAMGLVFRDDGEFWMDFRDFLTNFSSLDICNLSPDLNNLASRQWVESAHKKQWVKGVSAGGRPNLRETHWTNPQFKVSLVDGDDDEDNLCSFLVELSQVDKRRMKHKGAKHTDLGFVVYQFDPKYSLPLPKKFFDSHNYVERCDHFIDSRQNSKRFLMPPGDYIIVPCTYDAKIEASFLLRIFFEKNHAAEDLDEQSQVTEVPSPNPEKDPELRTKEDNFRRYFYEVSGEDMEVDAFELHNVLNNSLRSDPNHKEITRDVCRAMINFVDIDNSGKLGYTEFVYLWNVIRMWKKTFVSYDVDRSGKMESLELRNALQAMGINVSSKIVAKLVNRYCDENDKISQDNFISLMVRFLQLSNMHKRHSKKNNNFIPLEQWLLDGFSL